MPNHITNVLRINAYKHEGAPPTLIKTILAAVKGKESPFDFERIIPMPPELQITSGSVSSNALALDDDNEATSILSFPLVREAGIKDITALRDFLRKQYLAHPEKGFPTLDAYLTRIKSNIKKHGALSWYEWSVKALGVPNGMPTA